MMLVSTRMASDYGKWPLAYKGTIIWNRLLLALCAKTVTEFRKLHLVCCNFIVFCVKTLVSYRILGPKNLFSSAKTKLMIGKTSSHHTSRHPSTIKEFMHV